MQCVARHILRLIKWWLSLPVEVRDGNGKHRMTGGKKTKQGTPQGGVISPLLANFYMNRFLKYWRITGSGEAFRAHVLYYANDFVILSRGHARETLAFTDAVMATLGLKFNEDKTSFNSTRAERFDFLGYTFGPHPSWRSGRMNLGANPSRKSAKRLKHKVDDILVESHTAPWPDVCDQLNAVLRGWSAYFGYGVRFTPFQATTVRYESPTASITYRYHP